jgi:hypothetical protein
LDLSNSLSHGGCVKTISEKLEKNTKKKYRKSKIYLITVAHYTGQQILTIFVALQVFEMFLSECQ